MRNVIELLDCEVVVLKNQDLCPNFGWETYHHLDKGSLIFVNIAVVRRRKDSDNLRESFVVPVMDLIAINLSLVSPNQGHQVILRQEVLAGFVPNPIKIIQKNEKICKNRQIIGPKT